MTKMQTELTLSNEAKRLLRNLTSALDRVAQELGKDQHQAPKSPTRLSEPGIITAISGELCACGCDTPK